MPSEARKAFDANVADVDRLLALHSTAGGAGQGRRYGLEVLNKSAIVLVTAYWEAYCEDIAAEMSANKAGAKLDKYVTCVEALLIEGEVPQVLRSLM